MMFWNAFHSGIILNSWMNWDMWYFRRARHSITIYIKPHALVIYFLFVLLFYEMLTILWQTFFNRFTALINKICDFSSMHLTPSASQIPVFNFGILKPNIWDMESTTYSKCILLKSNIYHVETTPWSAPNIPSDSKYPMLQVRG